MNDDRFSGYAWYIAKKDISKWGVKKGDRVFYTQSTYELEKASLKPVTKKNDPSKDEASKDEVGE